MDREKLSLFAHRAMCGGLHIHTNAAGPELHSTPPFQTQMLLFSTEWSSPGSLDRRKTPAVSAL